MAVNVIIQSAVMRTNIAVNTLNTRMNKGIDGINKDFGIWNCLREKEQKMGLLDLLKKKEQKKDIFDIPYDYDGYDFMYKCGTMNPGLYREIHKIITNGKYDLTELAEYNQLSKDSDEGDFTIFYDNWIESLTGKGFMVHLDNQVDIDTFVKQINVILEQLDVVGRMNENAVIDRYNEELENYSMNGEPIRTGFIYNVLEANIVADELRKIGYELINFFNGCDNCDMTIVPVGKIEKMKEIENQICRE